MGGEMMVERLQEQTEAALKQVQPSLVPIRVPCAHRVMPLPQPGAAREAGRAAAVALRPASAPCRVRTVCGAARGAAQALVWVGGRAGGEWRGASH